MLIILLSSIVLLSDAFFKVELKGRQAKFDYGSRKYGHHPSQLIGKKKRTIELKSSIKNNRNVEYYCTVAIGTPPVQRFNVVIDTGSSINWVVSSECEKQSCKDVNAYNSSLSSTFSKTDRKWRATYSDDSYSLGYIGVDSFSFVSDENETLTLKELSIGFATDVKGYDNIDGLIGLAFGTVQTYGTSSLVSALEQSSLFDSTVFTIWLNDEEHVEGMPGGMLTLGGFDNDHCEEEISYIPLSIAGVWQYSIRSIGVRNYFVRKTWEAISDSGASYVLGPTDAIYGMAKAVGAKFDERKDVFIIACNEGLPPIEIVIGSRTYYIHPENYVLKIHEDLCVFGFHFIHRMGVTNMWVFGDVFLREYCHVHDVGKKQIGLARSRTFNRTSFK